MFFILTISYCLYCWLVQSAFGIRNLLALQNLNEFKDVYSNSDNKKSWKEKKGGGIFLQL